MQEFTASLDAMRPALVTGVEEAAHRIVEMSGLGVEVRLGPSADDAGSMDWRRCST